MWILDFFNTQARQPVNAPLGFRIHIVPVYGTVSMLIGGPLHSWEEADGWSRADILPGEERFNVPEGVVCALERPGQELFYFQTPKRPAPLATVHITNAVPAGDVLA
jgi:hypothetical protein